MSTKYLNIRGGNIAYDVQGSGPLVICAPGLGDVRAEYRYLVPHLLEAGYHVATLDLRGHGESSVGWQDMSIAAHAEDLIALIRALDVDSATLVGTSFSASSVIWAALEAPELVEKVVIAGPFVRDTMPLWLSKYIFSPLFSGPWGVAAWQLFYGTLYPVQKPADYADYIKQLGKTLRQPGKLKAVRQLLNQSKQQLTKRLNQLHQPLLIVMGEYDPDFKQPNQEAAWIAEQTGGTVALIAQAGHYPHVEQPTTTAQQIMHFLQGGADYAP